MERPQASLLHQFLWEEGQGEDQTQATEDSVRREGAERVRICPDPPSSQSLKDIL